MKTTLTSLAVAVLTLFAASTVVAQTADTKSREEVKKEAAAANKAGQTKVKEGGEPPAKAAPSTTDRAAVKKDTAAATKTGQTKVKEGGEPPTKAAPSTVDRTAVKKDAAAANKAGETNIGQMSPQQKADEGAAPKKK